jgi:hypothetical protein
MPHSYAITVLFDLNAVNASDLKYNVREKEELLVHKTHKNVKLSDRRKTQEIVKGKKVLSSAIY